MLGFRASRNSSQGSRVPRVVVRACAKVNLALEVLGRRADGYHEIRSLLWAIDLADRVVLEAIPTGIELVCDAPGVPTGPENLAWRAAELIRQAGRTERGVRIRLAKRIPAGAGLGGGSADAAAVLGGLPRLWGLRLGPVTLARLGTRLGMDVPFFLGEGPALATGRGERLRAAPRGPEVTLVVVYPELSLATREVYGGLRPAHFTDGTRVRALAAALPRGATALAAAVWNGLEAPVLGRWPGLGEVKAALREAGALAAVMSGSGSSVIGIAPSRAAGGRIRARLAGRPWRTWVTRTVTGPALTVEARAGRGAWGVAKR